MSRLSATILKYTVSSRRHLTPELTLRLITPACDLWSAREEDSPFKDPFWAFYWPGGQATARYILDNAGVVKNHNVLDIGCGCGAGAIAAAKVKAKHVVANDIDPYAISATSINSELNNVDLETSNKNFIGANCEQFDTILIGDMFYDEEFANILFYWLHTLSKSGKNVLIGDPGRHGLTEKRRRHMTLLAEYPLMPDTCLENHGFTHTTLWKVNPE